MLQRLGLRRVAYDWRGEHVASFAEEFALYRERGLELFAFWDEHPEAFRLFQEQDLHPQIWKIVPDAGGDSPEARVTAAADALEPLARRTAELGCRLGLYNHGGWGGEPRNLIAVCEELRARGHAHAGIVYNLHHAHAEFAEFASALSRMQPYLLCLNLNGMQTDGERTGEKILPIGAGENDRRWLRAIRDAGYAGPLGILGHTQDDVELRLRDNLDGLEWLLGDAAEPPPTYRTWTPPPSRALHTAADAAAEAAAGSPADPAPPSPYTPELAAALVERARLEGDADRGLLAFAGPRAACLACHRLGPRGGQAGPELTSLARQRSPEQIVESVLWPARSVEPQYNAWLVIDAEGRSHQGYAASRDEETLVLRDPARPDAEPQRFRRAELAWEEPVGTLMPDHLAAALGESQLLDVLRLLLSLGADDDLPEERRAMLLRHAAGHVHDAVDFPYEAGPLRPERHPGSTRPVNRTRVYDFYAKQADYFRRQATIPPIVAEFPGLDGKEFGHWGSQNEDVWRDDRWNATQLGSLQCGAFHGSDAGAVVPRAVCVRLPGEPTRAVSFDPDRLAFHAAWRDGFVKFSDKRRGFLDGLKQDGASLAPPAAERPAGPLNYRGFYRHGERVAFRYDAAGVPWLEEPVVDGEGLASVAAPLDEHPSRELAAGGPAQWPDEIVVPIALGSESPYAIDAIGLPVDNPWRALLFVSAHAFLPDGTAVVCTMQGDVWRVKDFRYPSTAARWKRIAAGLHQPLGVYADAEGLFVAGRDQITRLHDLNGDEEIDFYECFSRAYETSSHGHDYVCGLERDAAGAFYVASSNQGLVRISADGREAAVLATGFRNPDGLGLLPEGLATVPCSEGNWTPASMLCAVPLPPAGSPVPVPPPHYGFGGPRDGQPPALPLVYLPRGVDNSSGGQTTVASDRWGPLDGQLLHFSFGAGTYALVLRDEAGGTRQGAVVPLPGEFRSGAHRGRFHPGDGQLYVSGMQGWGSYAPEDGCLQRVRYTGERAQLPIGFHVHANGILLRFSEPLDSQAAASASHHFVQAWNYRYRQAYGSPEFSPSHGDLRGHDVLWIRSVHVPADGRSLFLELPELQPTNVVHLNVQTGPEERHDLFVTVHALDGPYTQLPDYRPRVKRVAAHPLLADLARQETPRPNPGATPLEGAREIVLETAANLSYATRTLRAAPGEALALTLVNPDTAPHNWALVRPGALQRVGELADRSIADPAAVLQHYVPATDDVLAYADVVQPGEKFTTYFRAPAEPGRYPYLCTFPGHWKLMQGELLVEERPLPEAGP